MKAQVQLSGRLGNQLFQWSFAHLLSEQLGEAVGLFGDRYHQPITLRSEIHNFFNCNHVYFSGNKNALGLQLKVLDKLHAFNPQFSLRLAAMLRWNRSLDAYTFPRQYGNSRRFSGFFQDYLVVTSCSKTIDAELLKVTDSVFRSLRLHLPRDYQFMHIRRGDLKGVANSFGLLGYGWYEKNIQPSVPIVASTDDMESAKDILANFQPTLILDPQRFSPLQTLAVMGNASRVVMGNSTLSWWGGYVAKLRGGDVMFPDPFYAGNDKITEKLCHPSFLPVKSNFILDE